MTYRSGLVTGVLGTAIVAGAAAACWWLLVAPQSGAAKSAPPPVPATVPKPFKDDQATHITLTPDAEARLGVKTATIERKPTKRVRVYGGEVTVPPGRSVVVSAPLAGTLRSSGSVPTAGAAVAKGQPVFQLVPLLTPEGRANLTAASVEADGQVKNAEEQLKGAAIALDRAKRVLAGGAGRQRDVDESQALADLAGKALAAAKARRDLLLKVVGDTDGGSTATPLPIEAPEGGVLRTVSALPGQTVPAGSPLFEVVDLETVWVRVPVYVGDLDGIDGAAPAQVGPLSARPGEPTRPADPVAAPPAANLLAGTADVFYALDNRQPHYAPGQRVGVTIALKGPADGLTVPWAAVVHDVQGGTWVYERVGDRAYARRRVVVRHVDGDTAVLATSPPVGTTVVTAGAAELFGTDAGFSK